MNHNRLNRAASAALAALLLSVAARATAAEADPMPDLVREYTADERSVGTFYYLHWTEPILDRQDGFFADWSDRLGRMDFASLPRDGQIDYLLLKNDIARERAEIVRQRARLAAMNELLSFRRAIADLELGRWRDQKVDPAGAAGILAGIGKAAKDLKDRIEKPKPDEGGKKPKDGDAEKAKDAGKLPVEPARALTAAQAVDDLRNGLKRWFEYHDGFRPDFSWWVRSAYGETATNLEAYAKFLREDIAGIKGKDDDPLLGEPIGREELTRQLQLEFIAYTPEEIIAIGERELTWCETELKRAAAGMGFTNDWKAAMAQVKKAHVPPGEQDELVGAIAREAAAFVKEKEFVTVPPLCEETWRMRMMPPETLKTIPYAAYSPPEMQVAYPRDDMKLDDKLMVMRGNNRHYTRLTVPHELIPGHHLQVFVAARSRDHRRVFGTPFYIEGWALYCELRLWDLGWPRTPEERIGMLFWRAHRAARIVTTVKFHLGQMKPDEMVAFLMERVGHEKFGATSEVRRFIADETPPLYQAGYLLGGRQLHVLHGEATGPGGLSERQFNDEVLRQNTMPIELLRAAIRKLPLRPDQTPSWRF